jgi:hypothetical protein
MFLFAVMIYWFTDIKYKSSVPTVLLFGIPFVCKYLNKQKKLNFALGTIFVLPFVLL